MKDEELFKKLDPDGHEHAILLSSGEVREDDSKWYECRYCGIWANVKSTFWDKINFSTAEGFDWMLEKAILKTDFAITFSYVKDRFGSYWHEVALIYLSDDRGDITEWANTKNTALRNALEKYYEGE